MSEYACIHTKMLNHKLLYLWEYAFEERHVLGIYKYTKQFGIFNYKVGTIVH